MATIQTNSINQCDNHYNLTTSIDIENKKIRSKEILAKTLDAIISGSSKNIILSLDVCYEQVSFLYDKKNTVYSNFNLIMQAIKANLFANDREIVTQIKYLYNTHYKTKQEIGAPKKYN